MPAILPTQIQKRISFQSNNESPSKNKIFASDVPQLPSSINKADSADLESYLDLEELLKQSRGVKEFAVEEAIRPYQTKKDKTSLMLLRLSF